MKKLPNIHPGQILRDDFVRPRGVLPTSLAKASGMSVRRVMDTMNGRQRITHDTDRCLSKFFGTSRGYWLRLQNAYDLEEARRNPGAA